MAGEREEKMGEGEESWGQCGWRGWLVGDLRCASSQLPFWEHLVSPWPARIKPSPGALPEQSVQVCKVWSQENGIYFE